MLENHKKNGVLHVASKKKKKKSKKKDAKSNGRKKETKEEKEKRLKEEKEFNKRVEEQDSDFKKKVWDKNFARVASLIQGQSEFNVENDNLMPFDFVATSDTEFDAQKDSVIEKIQHLLVENKPDDSITLFREARFLWPNDRDLFGHASIQADEEFETFKNLFMKELEIKKPEVKKLEEKEEEEEVVEEIKSNKKPKGKERDEGIEDDFDDEAEKEEAEEAERLMKEKFNEEAEYEEEDKDEDDDEPGGYVVEEENLDFEKFLFRFTHPHVLKSYILMLGEYSKNSDFLNRCCMSMFERIAYECHAPQCLYQLSLFNLINKIYKDPLSRCTMNILDNTQQRSIDNIYASSYSNEDMFAFFRQLISKFYEQTQKNPKLFLEILFFKDKKIIFELGEDSAGYQEANVGTGSNGKNRKIAWTQEEQDELKDLFEKFKPRFIKENEDESDQEPEPDEQDAGDIIDLIMLNMKDGSRKRKDLCNQLVNIGCVKSVDEFKSEKFTFKNKKRLGRNKLWRPEDIEDLKQSFELVSDEAKQMNKPLSEMMNKLQTCLKVKRNKSAIIDKLLNLNLIKSRNDLKPPKGKKKQKNNEDDDNKFIDDSDDSDKESNKKKKKEKSKKKKEKDSSKPKDDLFDAESGSSSDGSDSSSSESESESESEESDEEDSSSKTKAPETRDQVLESLGLNEESNESNQSLITRKPKKKLSKLIDTDNDSQNLDLNEESNESKKSQKPKKKGKIFIEKDNDSESLGLSDESNDSNKSKTDRKPKKKASKVIEKINESEDEEDEMVKKKSVAKKRKKVLDSNDDDSRSSTDTKKENNKKTEKILENKKIMDSDDDSDDDLPLGSLISSKRQRLVLSEDDD